MENNNSKSNNYLRCGEMERDHPIFSGMSRFTETPQIKKILITNKNKFNEKETRTQFLKSISFPQISNKMCSYKLAKAIKK